MKKFILDRCIIQLGFMATALAVMISIALVEVPYAHAQAIPINTQLWTGPYEININPDLNIAYPDTGAVYWTSKITIPKGARLKLVGQYAHARYISISAYNMVAGTPTETLNDTGIEPDKGSINPFYPGERRNSDKDRNFTIMVLNEVPPADESRRMPNTLYAKSGDKGELAMIWRIYVPDKDTGITGGVELPKPQVILEDGTVLDTRASCDALSIDATIFSPKFLDLKTYMALRNGLILKKYGWQGDIPPTFPSQNPPVFKKVFNIKESMMCNFAKRFSGNCDPAPKYTVGQYANLDNQYMSVPVNRGFAELVVVRGKAPVTPKTYNHAPVMQEKVDMRYWSLTTNESLVTTKVTDGAYDEEIPLDPDGCYTIVISLPADRPGNAVNEKGVQWIKWPEKGDGVGHVNDAKLILRHMLPSPDFTHSIQNVEIPGRESEVLGPYMPICRYMTREAFEALGDQPWKQLKN